MGFLIKPLTGLLGIVLTIIGIAGFFSGGNLFGFEVNALHNVVHLLSGLLALYCVNASRSAARTYLILFGLVYGVVAIVGFVMGGDIFGLFHTNAADNYLRTGIAAACLVVGLGSKK